MPARRATSSMVSSCTGVVGSSSRPISTSWARRSPADRRRPGLSAAAELLRAHVLPEPGLPLSGQLPAMLDRFVGWVETYRESYVAFVRGAAGGDPWVAETYEETREQLVGTALAALQIPADPVSRQLVRAWFAFTEELVGQWTRDPSTMSRADLLTLLRDVLDRLTTA